MTGHHSHEHPEKSRGQDWKYITLITLIGSFFFVELGVSIYAGSLALQTDAVHMLADLLALLIGYISYRLTLREKTSKFTYGWTRAEIIGSLINSVFLMAICFSVLIELIHKVSSLVENNHQNPELFREIDLVLIVAGIGLAVNLFGMILFYQQHAHSHKAAHEAIEIEASELSELESELEHMEEGITKVAGSSRSKTKPEDGIENTNNLTGPQIAITSKTEKPDGDEAHDVTSVNGAGSSIQLRQGEHMKIEGHRHRHHQRKNLNQYAVFLHIAGDTLGSVAVVVSGLAIKYWDWVGRFYLDPLVSLIMVVIIGIGSARLLKQCVSILLHQSPVEIDSEKLLAEIRQVSGVIEVHEFHLWSLNNRVKIASLHVRLEENVLMQSDLVLEKIKEVLHGHGVHVSTIQPEWENQCLDPRCSGDEQEIKECQASRCCSETPEK